MEILALLAVGGVIVAYVLPQIDDSLREADVVMQEATGRAPFGAAGRAAVMLATLAFLGGCFACGAAPLWMGE